MAAVSLPLVGRTMQGRIESKLSASDTFHALFLYAVHLKKYSDQVGHLTLLEITNIFKERVSFDDPLMRVESVRVRLNRDRSVEVLLNVGFVDFETDHTINIEGYDAEYGSGSAVTALAIYMGRRDRVDPHNTVHLDEL